MNDYDIAIEFGNSESAEGRVESASRYYLKAIALILRKKLNSEAK